MISGRELLRRTGISRAELNSYIALGIVPAPLLSPSPADSGEGQRESWFPSPVLERVEEVQRLKAAGFPMAVIAGRLAAAPEKAASSSAQSVAQRGLVLNYDEIAHPAYTLDHRFELTWCNELARKEILGFAVPAAGGEARNIFLLLLDAYGDDCTARRDSLLRLHLTFAKARLSRLRMSGLLKNVEPRHSQALARMYDEAPIVSGQTVAEIPYRLHDNAGVSRGCKAYGIFLRDGLLTVHSNERE